MMRTRTPQKSNRKTTILILHCAFLYISKPSLHDQYVKLPNYPSWWGRELKKNNFLFLSLKYEEKNLYNSTPEKNLSKFGKINDKESERWILKQREHAIVVA